MVLDSGRATFVFVQAEDVTPSGVRTWGESHAEVWATLREAGRAVEVVVDRYLARHHAVRHVPGVDPVRRHLSAFGLVERLLA